MRRIWSEHVPYEELRSRRVLRLLASRSIRVLIAVQPRMLPGLARVLEACAGAGLEVGLWPMLEDDEGRWPSHANVGAYRTHLLEVLDAAATAPARPVELIVDLEPPIAAMRDALALRLLSGRASLRPSRLELAASSFASLVCEASGAGVPVTAVVPPMVLCDPPGRRGGWQRLLGTPVDAVGFERITVMAYTSLIEGYARGALARRHARALLWLLCRRALDRWPGRAAVALGAVGGGALGDERPYRSLAELEDDVALASAVGVDDLALFELSAVLAREPSPERWLDVFVETEPAAAPPRLEPFAAAVLRGADAAGWLYDTCCRALALDGQGAAGRPSAFDVLR
jgi:hypothetical protein